MTNPPDDPMLQEALRMMAEKGHPALQSPTGGKAFLAICAALLCPGLGHALAGYYKRAGIWFVIVSGLLAGAVAALLIPKYVWALPVLLPAAVLAQLGQLLDGVYCGRHSRSNMLGDTFIRYTVGVAMAGMAYFWQNNGTDYIENNFVEVCYSPTSSMAPAIDTTDYFLHRKRAAFARWDIVVLNSPDPKYPSLIKRLVGLPGEKIEITGDGLLIDDKLMPLPQGVDRYLPMDVGGDVVDGPSPSAANGCWGKPITLGSDEYFLLGDNSPVSEDSRFWPSMDGHQPGAMPRNEILGRVVAILWPPSRWRDFASTADQ